MDENHQSENSYNSEVDHVGSRWKQLARKSPDSMHAFGSLHRAAFKSGHLDAKTKELIALAIAVNTHCDACIGFHTRDALKAGASTDEILEAMNVCILMGGGPAATYAAHVMDALEDFEN